MTQFLSRADAAQYLSIAEKTLAKWATTGAYNLPYIRVGRAVRYRQSDLDAWLKSRTVGGVEK